MDYSGEGPAILTLSDTESSDEENQLSQLLTEPSSDSNESQSTHYTNGELIEIENVEDLNQQSPVEHDATQNVLCQPEDASIESTTSEDSPSLSSIGTTDSEKEPTPVTPRATKKRPSTLKGPIARKICFPESPGSLSDDSDSSNDK